MAFAIVIKAMGATAAPIRNLWDRFGALEPSPSMLALGYPPHLTLAVYEILPEQRLCELLRCVFRDQGPFRLRFGGLARFESPRFVVYAAPDKSEQLARAHYALHRLIPPQHCHSHYRPGCWVPHATLPTGIEATNRPAADAIIAEGLDPFEVDFDCADAVEFHPVRVIEEIVLPAFEVRKA